MSIRRRQERINKMAQSTARQNEQVVEIVPEIPKIVLYDEDNEEDELIIIERKVIPGKLNEVKLEATISVEEPIEEIVEEPITTEPEVLPKKRGRKKKETT